MTQRPTSTGDHPDAGWYEIRLTGHLGPRWAAWFDGLTVRETSDGTTVITGHLADQAALHGVLSRIRDLGLGLLSVNRIDGRPPTTEPPPTDDLS